jgi:hypothetical protein
MCLSAVNDGGAFIEHSHKQRHAAAVETSAKLENQHSEEQELVDQYHFTNNHRDASNVVCSKN